MLIGRLGRDPELRYTQGNQAVTTLRVATSENWKDKTSGERKEATEWHRVVVWGRQAENCNKFLAKGRQVYIEGTLRTREWEDKDGNRRFTTEVVARNVQFLDGGGSADGSGGDPPPPNDNDADFDHGFNDDEIPF
ncbi:MAG: single-stranded DNA-binding protein [Myxococcales bacterium]|nr:single-stranded DNA-binding protein [Myxococcales bacterium]